MSWYYFDQNNSGGSFDHDPSRGIGYGLFVEANSADEANSRAEDIGLYFDGYGDCECCGNRWSSAWRDDGNPEPTRYGERWRAVKDGENGDTEWGINLYIHPLDGKFSVATRNKD